jgi:hypothetical protein
METFSAEISVAWTHVILEGICCWFLLLVPKIPTVPSLHQRSSHAASKQTFVGNGVFWAGSTGSPGSAPKPYYFESVSCVQEGKLRQGRHLPK